MLATDCGAQFSSDGTAGDVELDVSGRKERDVFTRGWEMEELVGSKCVGVDIELSGER
jgi:hypothetical protein